MNSSPSVTPSTSGEPNPPEKNQPASSSHGPSVFKNARFWGFAGFIAFFLVPLFFRVEFSTFCYAVLTFLEVVVLFNLLIIVHELGHFLAAKKCGLVVDKFAIWFGKPLWSKKIDGVEYILGSIPAGGYVVLPQMAPMETIEGKAEVRAEELPPASPWQKIIVAFAGPLFSFGLAVFCAVIVWIVGRPVSYSEQTTTIGYAFPDGPAYKAGLRSGDVIKSVDGHQVRRWFGVPDGLTWCIVTSTSDALAIDVKRGDQMLSFQVTPEVDPDSPHPHWWERSEPPKIMISPAEKSIVVGKVYPYSPASYAGLATGEKLLALNGEKLLSSAVIGEYVKDHPHTPMQLTVESGGVTWPVTLTPVRPISPKDIPKELPQTSLGFEPSNDVDMIMDHPGPWLQVTEAASAVRGTVAALFAKHSKVNASELRGPVGIMNIFYSVLSTKDGWRTALWLAVVINVNLAMLNLLPFPILDGGHILLSLIEWVRRRPLSMRILEPLQTGFALLLISYMAYITFFDMQDTGHMAMGDELRFAPQSVTH